MAVTIKQKELTLVSLAKRIVGSDEVIKLAKAIEAGGFTLVTEANLIKVENDANLLAYTPLKLSSIDACLKGTLSYTGKKVLQEHVEAFIKKAFNLMPDAQEQVNLNDIYDETMKKYFAKGGGNKVAAIKKYRELTGASLKEAKDKVEAWISDLTDIANNPDVQKIIKEANKEDDNAKFHAPDSPQPADIKPEVADVTAAPVSLSNASMLMQPVKGTSTSSIYNVIALGEHAKVAVRIKKDNNIAIRVSPLTSHGKKACATAGLDKKEGGHYSLHLHPTEKSLVNKTVGAVLFAMDLDWDGVVANMSDLVGVGK